MKLAADGYGLLPVTEVDPSLLAEFRCGKPHLDEFLVKAPEFHRDRLGLTTVAFHRDELGVVGYFTLANDALPLTSSEQFELNVNDRLKAYPAVKLGRLAVSSRVQRRGVGRQLISFIHGEILDSKSLSAARLAIVDADAEPQVLSFYRAVGYLESLWAESQSRNTPRGRDHKPLATTKMIKDILAS